MSATPETPQVSINEVDTETLLVPIVGESPLVCHNWSVKAKRQMLDAQQGRKKLKVSRDPDAEYEAAFYHTKSGNGFPSIAFKSATVGAARFYGKDVSMTALRQVLFFRGVLSDNDPQQLFEIVGEPRMREDMVRVGMGSSDLRYRPEFPQWSATLEVRYVRSSLTRESVLSLINAGGMGVGVGEWRPEKKGDFGTYRVDPTRDVDILS